VLTAREIDILRLVATGSTNREIAGRLFLSEGTVKNHISRILGRLGLRDRTQAAVYAHDHGLLPDR
jgi:DNA-binding NarL/FixJ family response regulator